jgi:hypothetical protein
MSEIVERVADAVARALHDGPSDKAIDLRDVARAAIRAILATVEERPTDDEAGRRLLYALEAAIKETA